MDAKQIKITVADSTTLGLFSLAIVTLVASSQKLGITDGLALDAFGCGHFWHIIAAYSELAILLLAFYVLVAKYLNSMFGKEILCTGKPFMQ